MRILIVEDDREAASYIRKGLRESGHVADHAGDGEEGLEMARAAEYDVLVVDRMMPRMDGLSMVEALRADDDRTPVLILSALGEVDDRVEGLKAGGDDYLVKPFSLQELHARLQALYKRNHRKKEKLLSVGDLTLNRSTLQVHRAGQRIDLTPAGMRILQRLMKEAPSVVAREDLEALLWADERPDGDALRSHLYKLRQAIDRPFDNPLIHTVHRIGYRIAEDAQ